MEQRISLITLGVADLARSRAFYEALGWRRGARKAEGVAFFQLGGLVLSLWTRAELAKETGLPLDSPGPYPFSLAHNVRTCREVDGVLKEAVSCGGKIVTPATEKSWGGYSGYFSDPDFYLWEVAFNPGFAILDDGSISLPQ